MWTALGMGVSVSLIAAAIYDYATGNHVRALIMGGAGLAAFFVAYFFGRKKPELTLSPPLMKDSGNATATATGGAGGNAAASIGDVIVNIPPFPSAPAPVPAPLADARPKLSFDEWGTIAETLNFWESGFRITNHGEAAIDVQVKRFQIAPGQFACGRNISSIAAHHNGFIPIWLEEYGDVPHSAEKWDLLSAMKRAFDSGRESEEHVAPIIARYKDFDDHMYESTADLRYIYYRNKLVFGPTRQRKVDAYSEVLAFLERTSQPGRAVKYFVEDIAEATGMPEMQVSDSLRRLYSEEHVYRGSIEGVGTGGGSTRWGYVYWYAHF